jgi:hypothetical protein
VQRTTGSVPVSHPEGSLTHDSADAPE